MIGGFAVATPIDGSLMDFTFGVPLDARTVELKRRLLEEDLAVEDEQALAELVLRVIFLAWRARRRSNVVLCMLRVRALPDKRQVLGERFDVSLRETPLEGPIEQTFHCTVSLKLFGLLARIAQLFQMSGVDVLFRAALDTLDMIVTHARREQSLCLARIEILDDVERFDDPIVEVLVACSLPLRKREGGSP